MRCLGYAKIGGIYNGSGNFWLMSSSECARVRWRYTDLKFPAF